MNLNRRRSTNENPTEMKLTREPKVEIAVLEALTRSDIPEMSSTSGKVNMVMVDIPGTSYAQLGHLIRRSVFCLARRCEI